MVRMSLAPDASLAKGMRGHVLRKALLDPKSAFILEDSHASRGMEKESKAVQTWDE